MSTDSPDIADEKREAARARIRAEYAELERLNQVLLEAIQARLPELEKLLANSSSHWQGEDGFYRYYHGSFKVYGLQSVTEQIVRALRALMPERPLSKFFLEIMSQGTGKTFEPNTGRFRAEGRAILEAYFHARTMLEYAVKYGRELEQLPRYLPSGWAAVLYLYDLR